MNATRLIALLLLAALLAAFVSWQQRPPLSNDPTPTAVAVAQTATLAPRPTSTLVAPTPTGTATLTASPVPTTVVPTQHEWQVPRPVRNLPALLAQWQRSPAAGATPTRPPVTPQTGERHSFWVQGAQGAGYRLTEARLVVRTANALFYVESGLAVDETALARSADSFERMTLPSLTPVFGELDRAGLDGQRRLTVLLASLQGVDGYHSSFDEEPRWVHPFSNERHIVYLRANAAPLGSDDFASLLAHETQHLLLWLRKPEADNWINEGRSELARLVTGQPPRTSAAAYLNNTDTQLTAWPIGGEPIAPHYGAAYLFLRYFGDQFGLQALAALVSAPGRGPDLFDAYLTSAGPTSRSFDDLFGDWLVANLLGELGGAGSQYGYLTEVPRVASSQTLRSGDRLTSAVSQYGVRYFTVPASTATQVLDIAGEQSAPLLPTQPHGGDYFWWSNRGDIMQSSLTFEADLSTVRRASLRFWAWYDLEDEYDFVYLQASDDGGESWTVLPATGTTTENATGNNLAVGWTGQSGNAAAASWVPEEVDLSLFAGGPVLLRFTYITDDGYLGDGFALDDLQIPDIGWSEGAEQGDGTLLPDGFVRSDNLVPQNYVVWLVRQGNRTTVEPISLTADGRARVWLAPSEQTSERLVLIVAAVAPLTTQRAPFSISLSEAGAVR